MRKKTKKGKMKARQKLDTTRGEENSRERMNEKIVKGLREDEDIRT